MTVLIENHIQGKNSVSKSECVLSVLIPTYNENRNLLELTKQIENNLLPLNFEIVFIDDHSPDGTADVAKNLAEVYDNIKTLIRPSKLGLGSAILDGLKVANGRFIAVMDADLQHSPDVLPVMYAEISRGYDIVVASRYVDGGGCESLTVSRKLISKGATYLAHILFSDTRKVRDVMSGYFMFKKNIVEGAKLNSTGYKMLLEFLVKCDYNRVSEVPYIFKNRFEGKSKLGPKEIFNYVVHLCKLYYALKIS